MNEIIAWLGWAVWALAALVLVAMLVAGWEQLASHADSRASFERRARAQAPAAVHSIDLRLDTQAAALAAEAAETTDAPATERQSRLATMTEVLARAADSRHALADRGHWMDTTPRVVDLKEPALNPREKAQASGRGPHR
jgi:hypothetical protein